MSVKSTMASEPVRDEQITATAPSVTSRYESTSTVSSESIAQLAYALWQQRGCPTGSAETDWLEAEQQLRNQNSSIQDRPLSRTAVSSL